MQGGLGGQSTVRSWLRRSGLFCSSVSQSVSQLQTMTSTAQCQRNNTDTAKDENGLILPRKIVNPCIQSPFRRDLNREIKWNSDK